MRWPRPGTIRARGSTTACLSRSCACGRKHMGRDRAWAMAWQGHVIAGCWFALGLASGRTQCPYGWVPRPRCQARITLAVYDRPPAISRVADDVRTTSYSGAMTMYGCQCGGRMLVYVTRTCGLRRTRYLRCAHCGETAKVVVQIDAQGRPPMLLLSPSTHLLASETRGVTIKSVD